MSNKLALTQKIMLYRKQEKKPVGFKYDYGTNEAQQDRTQGKTEEEEEQELIKDILLVKVGHKQ